MWFKTESQIPTNSLHQRQLRYNMKWEEKHNSFAYSVSDYSAHHATLHVFRQKHNATFTNEGFLSLKNIVREKFGVISNHRPTKGIRVCRKKSLCCTRGTEKYQCQEAHNKTVSRAELSFHPWDPIRPTKMTTALQGNWTEGGEDGTAKDFLSWKTWFHDALTNPSCWTC